MEADTGATVTVVPKEVYNRHLSHVELQPSAVKLQAYNGERLKVLGEAMVQIRYKGQQACDKLIVVGVKEKPAVLGRNWISHFQLDWSSLFRVGPRHEIDPSKEFPQLFAEGMGMLTGYEANITLTPEARPRIHRPRPVPYALQAKVETELERLQKEGILRPVRAVIGQRPLSLSGKEMVLSESAVTIRLPSTHS